ncbi:MAG: hypothetical protein JNK45_32420, partial [Myxococcales bacterium]|nr:hypothetical protein [Myxococcales bacterium]
MAGIQGRRGALARVGGVFGGLLVGALARPRAAAAAPAQGNDDDDPDTDGSDIERLIARLEHFERTLDKLRDRLNKLAGKVPNLVDRELAHPAALALLGQLDAVREVAAQL